MNIKKCKEAVRHQIQHKGKYWIIRQMKLHQAIIQGKGKFKNMSLQNRKNMLVSIEIQEFGHSPILEQDKQRFLEWHEEVFDRPYK